MLQCDATIAALAFRQPPGEPLVGTAAPTVESLSRVFFPVLLLLPP